MSAELIDPSVYEVNNWEYLQEGNENLVLVYKGHVPLLKNYILRLTKKHQDDKNGNQTDIQIKNTAFTDKVVIPLLGKNYISDKLYISVTPAFLSELDEFILPSRPANRTHKRIDTNNPHAVLTQNIIKIPSQFSKNNQANTFSIEIKPKWGFLPTSSFIKSQNIVKHNNCRFCMHQVLKSTRSESSGEKSLYCPIKLYSNEYSDMYLAVENLFQCPQNNLRTFGNGKELPVVEALSFVSDLFKIDRSKSLSFITELIVQALLEDGILNRLKELQGKLDVYDIEGVYKIFQSLDGSLPEPEESEWEDISKSFLEGYFDKTKSNPESLDEAEKLRIIYGYLASATFKDCSILVSFTSSISDLSQHVEGLLPIQRLTSYNSPHLNQFYNNSDARIYYQLGAVDLDPKSLNKLDHYYKLDQEIVDCFKHNTN